MVGAKEYQAGDPGLILPPAQCGYLLYTFFLYTSQKYSSFVEYAHRSVSIATSGLLPATDSRCQ